MAVRTHPVSVAPFTRGGAVARVRDITDIMGGNVFHERRFTYRGPTTNRVSAEAAGTGVYILASRAVCGFVALGAAGACGWGVWSSRVLRGGVWNGCREGRLLKEVFCPTHPVATIRIPDRCFDVAVHDGHIDDTFIDVSVRPCGFVPPSVDEGSTHVSVCEARPVQRGYANQSSSSVVVFLF